MDALGATQRSQSSLEILQYVDWRTIAFFMILGITAIFIQFTTFLASKVTGQVKGKVTRFFPKTC